MQVGSWFLFFGPSTLVLIFHILAVGSFILVSSICSAFSVAFSSLIMSSRFWRCDCLRFVCFLCEMPFGLNLMPKASMSISNFTLHLVNVFFIEHCSLIFDLNYKLSSFSLKQCGHLLKRMGMHLWSSRIMIKAPFYFSDNS